MTVYLVIQIVPDGVWRVVSPRWLTFAEATVLAARGERRIVVRG